LQAVKLLFFACKFILLFCNLILPGAYLFFSNQENYYFLGQALAAKLLFSGQQNYCSEAAKFTVLATKLLFMATDRIIV